jgi:5-formyltetrahydrofolate cyclo-ligase
MTTVAEHSKNEWRQLLRAKRKALSVVHRARYAEQITHFAINLVLGRFTQVGLYAAMGSEVSTWSLFEKLQEHGVSTFFPRSCPQTGLLEWAVVREKAELKPGHFGVLEPCGLSAPLAQHIAVFMPGLGFDAQGVRIGYGGGYYDRSLQGWHGCRVGLAFEVQKVACLPHRPHDLKVHHLVTELGVDTLSEFMEAAG